MAQPISSGQCNHTRWNHFFNPSCDHQSTLSKVVAIAFHVLTLGLVYAAYRLESRYHLTEKISNSNPKEIFLNSNILKKKGISNYSPLEQAALDFARAKLTETTEPFKFNAGWNSASNTHQPANPEIAKLTTLFFEQEKVVFDLIKTKKDPWSDQQVIEATDQAIKMAFAVSILTLEDLPQFTAKLEEKGEKRSYAKALTQQDSYMYRTYYFGTQLYHSVRGEMSWSEEQSEYGFPVEKKNCEVFFKKETTEANWRQLYNSFCSRVREYVVEKDLEMADSRHHRWTKPDLKKENFRPVPDTLPT